MPYIVMRGRWYNITVPNMYAQSEDKGDSAKDSFHEELQQAFNHFPKYDMKNWVILRPKWGERIFSSRL